MQEPQSKINFVFFAFGENLNNYLLGNFCILSLLKSAPKNSKIIVYTDKPDFYKLTKDLITIRQFDASIIQEWKGAHDFVWRVKIKTMLNAAQKDEGHIIYLDADTFLYKNLDKLISELDQGHSFMHLNEGSKIQTKSQGRMINLIDNKEITGIKMHKDLCMWNAGVVAIPEKHKMSLTKHALELCDALCDLSDDNYYFEQFSLSTVLSTQSSLLASDEYFKHFWGNKSEWLERIDAFFSQAHIKQLTASELVDSLDVDAWVSLPIYRKTKKIKTKLSNLLNNVLSDKVF